MIKPSWPRVLTVSAIVCATALAATPSARADLRAPNSVPAAAPELPDLDDAGSARTQRVESARPKTYSQINQLPALPRVEQPARATDTVRGQAAPAPIQQPAAARDLVLPANSHQALNGLQDPGLEEISDSGDEPSVHPAAQAQAGNLQGGAPVEGGAGEMPVPPAGAQPRGAEQTPGAAAAGPGNAVPLPLLPGSPDASGVAPDPAAPVGFLYRGVVPGAPVPLNLADADALRLDSLEVDVVLRQHTARYTLKSVLTNISDRTVRPVFAFPVTPVSGQDNLPASFGAAPYQPALPGRLGELVVTADSYIVKHGFRQEAHPQAATPSLQPLAKYHDWVTAETRFKPGETRTISISFVAPLSSKVELDAQTRKTRIGASTAALDMFPAYVWNGDVRNLRVTLWPEEMLGTSVRAPRQFQKSGSNLVWATQDWQPSVQDDIAIEAVPQMTVSDLPDGNSRLETGLEVGSGKTTTDYTVQATSSAASVGGAASTPENLRDFPGVWAEGVSGNGVREAVMLTLNAPGNLVGLEVLAGLNPGLTPAGAQNPNGVFRDYARPVRVKVTLNDEYDFYATLRDDYRPQYLIQPGYFKKVKTIRVELVEVAGGNRFSDTCITRVRPVVK